MESEPFFFERDKTDTKIRRNTKATVTCLKKKGLAFRVCACRANTKLIFQVETRKFGRGIAEQQKMIVIACVMHGNRVLAISLDE